MKTLHEIKDELSKLYGHVDFKSFWSYQVDPDTVECDASVFLKFMDELSVLYAEQAIDRAAERTNYPYRDEFGCVCNVPYIVLSVKEELK